MIGTGVFTTLGFQIVAVQSTWSIILLWTIGGILALIGALTFAELGTHYPDSGGDYVFLSRLIHPFAGYVYAWTSLTVGFSAPIAISAMAMTSYMSFINDSIFNKWLGIGVIVLITTVHSISVGQSGKVQRVSTLLKLLFILVIVLLGVSFSGLDASALSYTSEWSEEIFTTGFAVSLIYVSYAYTGWNSATYISNEIEDPQKNLPKALIPATLLVTFCYISIQLVFLKHSTVDQIANQVEVASIAASNMMGSSAAHWVGICIGIQLVATISGYLWVGSRVAYAMAKEHPLWSAIAIKSDQGIPLRALWLQSAIAIFIVLTGTFEIVLVYASFALQLMGTITVASVINLKRKKGLFHSPFRPWLQLIYIVFSMGVLGYTLYERPLEAMIGLGIIMIGGLTYFFQSHS